MCATVWVQRHCCRSSGQQEHSHPGGCELQQTMAHILRACIQPGDKGAVSGRVCPHHHRPPRSGVKFSREQTQRTGPKPPSSCVCWVFFPPHGGSLRGNKRRLQSVITSLDLPPSRHLKVNQPERLPNQLLIKGCETHEPPALSCNPA